MEGKKACNKVKRPLVEDGGVCVGAAREEQKRRKHTEEVKALGEEDESVKLLEELVFGAEEELLERLHVGLIHKTHTFLLILMELGCCYCTCPAFLDLTAPLFCSVFSNRVN